MAKIRSKNGIITEDWYDEIVLNGQRVQLIELVPYGITSVSIKKIIEHITKVENILNANGYYNVRFQAYGSRVLADRPQTDAEKQAAIEYRKKHAKRLAAEKLALAKEKARLEEKKKKKEERARARRLKQFEKLKKEFARG